MEGNPRRRLVRRGEKRNESSYAVSHANVVADTSSSTRSVAETGHGADSSRSDSSDSDSGELPWVSREKEAPAAPFAEPDEYDIGGCESGLSSPTRGAAIRKAVERGEIFSPPRDQFATPTKSATLATNNFHSPQSIASPSATPGDCPICLFPLAEPETLECAHTYCSSCIDSVRRRNRKKTPKERRPLAKLPNNTYGYKDAEPECPLCSRTSSALFIQQRWHCRAVVAIAQETAIANENETNRLRSGMYGGHDR